MAGFFTRQRIGRPQFLAGALLLLFLAQAIWLVHSELRASESSSLSASEASSHRRRLAPNSRWPNRGRPISRCCRRAPYRNFSRQFRLRYRALSAHLPGNRRAPARLATQPERCRISLALASPHSISRLRSLSRRLALVRRPPPLRQHWRLPRPHPLLLFSRHSASHRRLARRT